MKRSATLLAATLALVGGLAFAKEAATNPAVIARQSLMKSIAGNMKVLGEMAGGKTTFDAPAARTAATALKAHADQIPATFKANETDASSEAKPEIWADWADFVEHAEELQTGAAAIDPASLDTLKASLGGAAGACKSCHTEFRMSLN